MKICINKGRENPFDHPHRETIDALYGVEIFLTDIDRDVKISKSDSLLKIKTCRDFGLIKVRSLKEEIKEFVVLLLFLHISPYVYP